MANQVSGESTPVMWSFSGKQPHLPPKSPLYPCVGTAVPDSGNSLFSSWSNFPFPTGGRKQHQRTPSASFIPQTAPSWIDDLLSDTPEAAPKKSSHRRSSSDSVAFLETPVNFSRIDEIAEEDEFDHASVASIPSRGSQDFDRLDEEQLMSMFADIEPFQKQQSQSPEVSTLAVPFLEKRAATMENPSTPSDHNSVNEHSFEEKITGGMGKFKSEPEVQSAWAVERAHQQAMKGEISSSSVPLDPNLDPKRAKRILANRQSAQRSRVRKLQYIAELERSVNALQAEVSTLSPQVAYLDHQRVVLNVDNSALKQRIAALAQDKLFKDAHYEALKKEVQRLKQLYQQQHHHQQHQLQQDTSFDLQQQQFSKLDLGTSLQSESKASLENSDLMKCPNVGSEQNEAGNTKIHAHPMSPVSSSIGNSSCVVGENIQGLDSRMIKGSAVILSDHILQNP